MARKDWVSVGVHTDMIFIIDEFLKTTHAQKYGIKSRQDFVNHLIDDFAERYRESTGLDLLPQRFRSSLFDLIERKKK